MLTRILLTALVLGVSASAAEQAPQSDICFTAPAQWGRLLDPNSHLLSLTSPDTGCAVTFTASGPFAGTAEEFHRAAWDRIGHALKIKSSPASGQQGDFLKTSAQFDKPNGTEVWICAYTTVKNGRSESVMLLAKSEEFLRANSPAVDEMVGGFTFASAGSASAADGPHPETLAESSAEPSAASMPAELSVGVPPGWSAQPDTVSHIMYMLPPNTPSARDAVFVVTPAIVFDGSADQFHQQAFARTTAQSQMLEPVHHGQLGGLQMSGAHYRNAQGVEVWMALYTARWGSKAQAMLWITDRKDLFMSNAKALTSTLQQVVVPGGPAPAPAAASASASAPASGGEASDTMPVLEYTDPPNFFRGGGKSYAEYQGSDVNFTLCIYPFREFKGDIRATFQQSMLRDWIDVMYREEGIAGQPRVVANSLVGADTVIDAHFSDGRNQEHHRLVIVSGHWAAIVDMIAPTAFAYQKGFPSVLEMLKTAHVGRKAAPPSLANGPGPAGARLAGLFQGFKGKFTVNLMLGPGYGSPKTALHYFLFSPDGRVCRCYDFPPGGSEAAARNFDFDSAERQDPQNSGRYAVRGNELYIKFGGPNLDEITATVTDPNNLQLDGVPYQRK